jgi:hypothetical protein
MARKDASFNIKLEWSPKDVQKKLGQSKEITEEAMKAGMNELMKFGTQKAQMFAPKYSGQTRGSLDPLSPYSLAKATPTEAVIGTKYYIGVVREFGTKPFWPPQESVAKWVRDKGIASGSEAERVAFFVRKKIAQKGIKGKHFIWGGAQEAMKKATEIMEQAAEKLLKGLGLK